MPSVLLFLHEIGFVGDFDFPWNVLTKLFFVPHIATRYVAIFYWIDL